MLWLAFIRSRKGIFYLEKLYRKVDNFKKMSDLTQCL